MAENLKTTHYSDDGDIPLVSDSASWSYPGTFSPGYCWHYNDEANFKAKYGALYNWYAVNTGKLCPSGWHVPSDEEWKILEINLGMTQTSSDAINWRGTNQGVQLKNSSGWEYGGNGTNTSGFSALPGGYRWDLFYSIGNEGFWWSSTEYATNVAWKRTLSNANGGIARSVMSKFVGLSVRCLKE
jgi:uncharacterized protein (TIGR02145 family)